MKFTEVKWQDSIIASLQTSIKAGTIGHALLFCGEEKSCKDLAHCTADALLCDRKQESACGTCPSCIKLKAGSHPDKIVIKAKKASIGVDEIRNFISELYIKPFLGNRKIAIFEEAGKLTPAAQNALLKVLEAPPDYGMILLAANKEEDLLPTVLSRLKKYQLAIPTGQQVGAYLAGKYPEQKELAYFCANFCEGSPTGAEELLRNGGGHAQRTRLLLFLDKLCGPSKSVVFDFAGYLEEHKDDFAQHANYLFSLLRDLIYLKQGLAQNQLINSDLKIELTALSAKVTAKNLQFLSDQLALCLKARKANASFPLLITNFLLKAWEELHD